ncbi:hypothetical protein [Bacterioplanoides sp.]|uniref:AbiU2 domain-containing protein n=1 Tax=Bacterioplanoides sp. TaxID=2066072 RepID=UPI003AFF783A
MDQGRKLTQLIELCRNFCCQYSCYALAKDSWHDSPGTLPIIIHNNFYDMAVLDFMKIFGDTNNDDFHYRKVLSNVDTVYEELLKNLVISQELWKAYRDEIKGFRDKRIAHCDKERHIDEPCLDIAYSAISTIYEAATKEKKEAGRLVYEDTLDTYRERNLVYWIVYAEELAKAFLNVERQCQKNN